jgi:hypothetical protein
MTTIDVTGYSAEWVAKALACLKRDGEVTLALGTHCVIPKWHEDDKNETRLVQAAAKLKETRK